MEYGNLMMIIEVELNTRISTLLVSIEPKSTLKKVNQQIFVTDIKEDKIRKIDNKDFIGNCINSLVSEATKTA